ncbi:MAG TPA: squalene/phytoene synthase family protein [Bacteroidales bacterium]|nr:squalene/phytoene synthase family protein [Bacteroidales bacterium]
MSANYNRDQFIEVFNSIEFEKVLDHPNILIAARFWDVERYCAAKVCYRFMRVIDDLIDNHKAANRLIAPEERKDFVADVNDWLRMIIISEDCNPEKVELIKTIERFRIPLWTLEDFARSMIYDINNDGFATLDDFLEYARGASVAPASIFVHLCGLKAENGTYTEPSFNVRDAATPCAVFSYLVHIIRDFQKDQFNNLNYFADDLILKYGLTRTEMRNIAHGSPVTTGFRKLMEEYYLLADRHRLETLDVIKRIGPSMEPAYRLSLEIIFSLYLMVFERIDVEKGNFTSYELNPQPAETGERVYNVIRNFPSF